MRDCACTLTCEVGHLLAQMGKASSLSLSYWPTQPQVARDLVSCIVACKTCVLCIVDHSHLSQPPIFVSLTRDPACRVSLRQPALSYRQQCTSLE
jgi:hypothetical protein